MKIIPILTSKIYLIMSTLLLMLILIYLFISGKMIENAWETKDTLLNEQLEIVRELEREITNLYLISSVSDWENKRKISIMIPDIKTRTYGSTYNYMFYSNNPSINITNISMTTTKPYKFLFVVNVKTKDSTKKSYIEIEYDDGFITKFTII